MIPEVCKIGKIYTHICIRKNGTEKWHNKMISCRHLLQPNLYLNSVSESEKAEDSKNLCFPENGTMILPEISL